MIVGTDSNRCKTDSGPAEDSELLRRYAEEGSDEAFAELVRRRIGLVYSVALRQTRGHSHRAQDVTQLVFTDLARISRQRESERSVQAEIDRMNKEGNALVEEFKALTARSKDASLSAENQRLRGLQISDAALEALRSDHAALPRLRAELEKLRRTNPEVR